MYLTVDLVSALNKSNCADQHVEIKYKVFAGKDGERFVKLQNTYAHLINASLDITTQYSCLMYGYIDILSFVT